MVFLFLLVACAKQKTADPPLTKKGFGESTERPEGTPFTLPAGISLNGKIKGYSVFFPEFCDNKTDDDAQGIGSLVRLCIPFFNDNSFPVTVTCPQGLTFIAQQVPGERIQNGMLVDEVRFIIPGKTVYYLPLYTCCLNEGRSASSPQFEYEIGPVTQDTDMKFVFNLLNQKKLSKDIELAVTIQTAIWNASIGRPQPSSVLNSIAALPDK